MSAGPLKPYEANKASTDVSRQLEEVVTSLKSYPGASLQIVLKQKVSYGPQIGGDVHGPVYGAATTFPSSLSSPGQVGSFDEGDGPGAQHGQKKLLSMMGDVLLRMDKLTKNCDRIETVVSGTHSTVSDTKLKVDKLAIKSDKNETDISELRSMMGNIKMGLDELNMKCDTTETESSVLKEINSMVGDIKSEMDKLTVKCDTTETDVSVLSEIHSMVVDIRSRMDKLTLECDTTETDSSASPVEHVKLIQQKYDFLLRKMAVSHPLIAELYSKGVIRDSEKESLTAIIDIPTKCTEKLLSMLEKKSDEAFKKFTDALSATGQKYVVDVLFGNEQGCEISKHEIVIKELYPTLSTSILTSELMIQLFSRDVIDHSDMENLNSFPVESKRCAKLLDILLRKSSEQFDLFIQALDDTCQGHVARLIRDKLSDLPRKQ